MTRPKQCPFPSNILPIKTEQVIHKKDGSETEENETPSPDPLMPEAKQRAPVSCEREHRIVLETVKQVLQQIKHFAAKHSLDGLDYEACKEAATELISQWGITPANNATSPTNNAVSPANNAGQKTTDNKADSGKEDRDSGTGEEIESSRESRQGSIQESTRSNDGLDGQVRSWQEFKSLYANNEVNVSYKIKSGIKHLNRFVAAVEKFEKVSPNIYSRLVKVQKYHLYKYCVSLAQEPNAYEVRSIREYDERICEYEKDIDSKMTSINNLYNQYNDLKSPFLGFVANGFEVSDIINTISVHIRDVCALMRKWVDDDKAYPERLWNEIIFSHLQRENIQSDIAKYHDKCDDIRMSLHKRELQRQKIIQRLDVLRKDRKKTRKSLETIDMQIERNQSEMDKRLREIDDMESQMSRRKSNSPAYFNRITTKTDQLRQDIDRMEHWHDTHSKQRERLAKKKDEVCGEISLLEKELEIHNLAQKDLHASLDANESKLDKHYEKLKKHHAHVNALKRTRDNKMSSLVLKKIYHKKLTEENKDVLGDACKAVAKSIGKNWISLYEELPFKPTRDRSRRLHDLELIDRIGARTDGTPQELAMTSLRKWRMLHRKGNVTELVYSLKRIEQRTLAQKIQRQFAEEQSA